MVIFTENNMKTLEKRYLLKDKEGKIIETPDQLFDRVVNCVCGKSKENKQLKENILEMMHDLRFLPNTPTLMNAGTTNMLSACFVVNIDDTLESIVHDAGWQQAYIHKMGGGVGINFSKLRPKGDLITTTGGVTTGVLGFLPIFNELSESIRQGGKRDGANMGLLSIHHPEIEDWIKAKVGNNKFRNFNLSVLIDDKFMRAVESNSDWELHFNEKIYKTVKAKYLFNLISESAYKCGCPGVIFVDEINRNNPLKDIMPIECTNPCVTGDTSVLTIDGYKQADNIKVGDLIITHNGNSFPIKKIEINGDMQIYTVHFDNNREIKCTNSHQFCVNYKSKSSNLINVFSSLSQLKVGDKIKQYEGDYATITSIEKMSVHRTVYDLYESITDTWITNNLISRGCGEQPLFVGYYNGELVAESCNLGSLNLSKYCIKNNNNGLYIFDEKKYVKDIHNATEFLDLVIDANHYPFPFIDKGTKLTRKIGLGTTGLSECLIKLKMEYGSEKSIFFIINIMEILQIQSHKKSEELGTKKGHFPLNHLMPALHQNRRNLFTTTIAPNGTTGRFMLGHPYSSGIEPPPAICMSSNIIDSKIEDGIHPLLIQMLKERMKYNPEFENFDLESTIKQIRENGKSIQHLTQIPEDIRKLFKVAEEISIEEHINIQSTIQKYIDNAVSKTINMNNSATIDDVKKAYLLAYTSKCKGVTVYRDNCKDHQVFESSKKEVTTVTHIDDLNPRDSMLPGITFTKRTGCSTLFITPTKMWNKDGALELFLNKSNEKGGCLGLQDGLAIAISVYNRYLESIDHQHALNALSLVTEHLLRKTCRASELAIEKQKQKLEKGEKVNRMIDSLSCPNAIAQCLKYMLEHDIDVTIDEEKHKLYNITDTKITSTIYENKKKCPECGNTILLKQEGCMNDLCPNCGWGGCS